MRLPLLEARAFRFMIEGAFWDLEYVAGPRAGANNCDDMFNGVIMVVDLNEDHLDCRIDTADRHERKSGMAFDDIDDAAIPLQNVDQVTSRFLPHEKVTVV